MVKGTPIKIPLTLEGNISSDKSTQKMMLEMFLIFLATEIPE